MCGIAGLIGGAPDARGFVERAIHSILYRGPDGNRVWGDAAAGVWLGHCRLAILDLSEHGAQPMADASGRFVLTFNGEIYNYLELRQELIAAGASFHSDSDTEVILEAYKHWGADCLRRFNGMFAFALFDAQAGKLFCARDRYGEKPFLFSLAKDFFAFASEYKALLQHPGISLDIDEVRLVRAAYNQSTGLDADRQTVFRQVQQLLPGEAMEVDVRELRTRIWRYWQIEPGEIREVADERAVFAEFRELLIDSVRLRLRSDVTVGSCLSGGLDSSSIVGIVRSLLGNDVPYHTFTGRFPGTPSDEWSYAQQVVDASGVISHVVEPGVDRFIADLPDFMWRNELPVGSSSQFAQWCVFHLAKQHGVTVLLDGQGADEALGGYEQYFGPYVQALRERGDQARLVRELPMIRERYPLALAPPARALRDRLPFGVRHWLSNRFDKGTSLLYGLRPDLARQVMGEAVLPRKEGFDPLANALVQDSFGRFLTTLLRYGDRNSMAHSREVRLPFCDHRLAEFVFRLPPHLLMGEVRTKRLLRESMHGLLPEPIRTRWNKQGFRPPQERWFQSPAFAALVRHTLNSGELAAGGLWNTAWWQRAMARLEAGESSLGWVLWHPFVIGQWHRNFLAPLRQSRASAGAA